MRVSHRRPSRAAQARAARAQKGRKAGGTHGDLAVARLRLLVVALDRRRVHLDLVALNLLADALLHENDLFGRHRVGLGDHRDQVEALAELFHRLDVEQLEAMASRLNKVQARMHAIVLNAGALRAHLMIEVRIILRLDIVDDRDPAVGIVDAVGEAGRVNEAQTQAEIALLEVCARTRR